MGAGDAGDIRPEGVHPEGVFGADIPQSQDQHPAPLDRDDLPQVTPDPGKLLVAVEVEVFGHHQRHPDHILGNRDAVAAGGVAEGDRFGQDPGFAVIVRPGALQLEEFQRAAVLQLGRGGVAEDDRRPFPGLLGDFPVKVPAGDDLPVRRRPAASVPDPFLQNQ